MRPAIDRLLADHDAVIPSVGSSIVIKDLAANAVPGLPRPGALFHRIDIRPGKPTLFARAGAKRSWVCAGSGCTVVPRSHSTALSFDSFTHR